MKNAMTIFMVLASFTITAQSKLSESKPHRQETKKNLTAEQKAELHSKKLTLELDLTDSQQKEIKQLFLDHKKDKSVYSKNRKEISSEEKFESKKANLDQRIALKRELQRILTKEQYEKWELKKQRKPHSKHKRGIKNKKENKGKN